VKRLAVLLLVVCGCAPPAPRHEASEALKACAALRGPAESVADVVTRLNALPRPVSVPCLVAALPRPVDVVASTSLTSAQPADSAQSPRIFFLTRGLVLSVVPAGVGLHLVELGQWTSSTVTLKAEIELPLTAPLAGDAPITRIKPVGAGSSTQCGLCHRGEAPHPTIDGGWVSIAYQPGKGTEVKLDALAKEHQGCVDRAEASERCDLFHALFDVGELGQGAFAAEVERFTQ